jgi:hypothetical protein
MLTQAKATITPTAHDPNSLDVELGPAGFTVSLDEIALAMRNADARQGFVLQAGLALAQAGQDTSTDFAAVLTTLQNYNYVASL